MKDDFTKERVYRIPTELKDQIEALPKEVFAQAFPDEMGGLWATEETIRGLEDTKSKIRILVDREVLPIIMHVETFPEANWYAGPLTCIALARYPNARGVCYCAPDYPGIDLIPEDIGEQLFYYGRSQEDNHLWVIILDKEDVAWCKELYRDDQMVMMALESLLIDMEDE
jgi:hypothetical protein